MTEHVLRTREFVDRTGVRWRVSEIAGEGPVDARPRERRAEPRSGERLAPKSKRLGTRPLALPWLCFESVTERRRVAPVPEEWNELPEDELEDLLGNSLVL